jgi:predicted DNA-binding protein with PD1-like motif
MQWRQVAEAEGLRTFVLICEDGDDPVAELERLAREQRLTGSAFTAIGAFRSATIGYFDRQSKEYDRRDVDEQCEVLSMLGDIAISDGAPSVHAHVVLGRSDFSTLGGHLFGAAVWPVLDIVVTESPTYLQKRHDPDSGLALLSP